MTTNYCSKGHRNEADVTRCTMCAAEMNVQAIIVSGNPVDGFVFVGPFASTAIAIDYAEVNLDRTEYAWWTAELHEATE